METPKGPGAAIMCINPSDEHHIQWVVALDNGEIWTFQNPHVRMQSNYTMGRLNVRKPSDANNQPSPAPTDGSRSPHQGRIWRGLAGGR
jgi:hypothetical protein